MKNESSLYLDDFIDVYSLYINTFIGKLIKKGKKDKAFKLYKNIKDDAGLKSLNGRLTALSKNCIDLITE